MENASRAFLDAVRVSRRQIRHVIGAATIDPALPTEVTVKVHLKSLLRKIDASNRTQAAIRGLNNGFADSVGGTVPTA